ncbi:xanthine dehydrogenase family protein subunit M [Segetibacter sp. 3557_3]|uniref:FAD binding domain-containing protein n=1 Tax=Segetibacter sp. 3557_3 TaxID=2547429 RepID=UPI0010584B60|nr:xanthine dehydrogenase family protein subunit M [Segetibacter sp. 3557_3]TDH26811.1 xanthine dehydrogenase family protein subunit M [Segetibacter sp. 3557_3]
MRPFKYSTINDIKSATNRLATNDNARYLAGGTNILDLMKEDVERPDELVDISRLKLAAVQPITTGANKGGISIGALGKNTETANHPLIRQAYPLLSQAILAGASAQIRNMATNGGNLNQRTRCPYFYEVSMPCNKREPGSGCGALKGINRMHAIFGWSEKCVAVHPSDMCIALVALDAIVNVQGPNGQQRSIPFEDYHRLPGDNPEKDNTLNPGELITSIHIPRNNFADRSYYLKVRDRASYAFALVSVGAALEMNGSNILTARIALGGVAHKPWRAKEAENFLAGKPATVENFRRAAEMEMKNAMTLEHNDFKVELGTRAIVRALSQAMKGGKHEELPA